jgi:antitoxin MazE
MKVNLIAIGNSKGVRIPASVIKECGLGDELEMHVEDGVIVLAPARGVRDGWDAAFEAMAAASDDEPMIPESLENDFDSEEWTW